MVFSGPSSPISPKPQKPLKPLLEAGQALFSRTHTPVKPLRAQAFFRWLPLASKVSPGHRLRSCRIAPRPECNSERIGPWTLHHPFYTWTMHMPGTEAPTVLWTRATRLPQIAKTDQLVIPSFRMQRPCGYNSKILKDAGCNCRDVRQQHITPTSTDEDVEVTPS